MKKVLYALLAGAMTLSSCNKSDDVPNLPQENQTTFSIAAPTTRAMATDLTRYIVEAYEGKDLTTTPVRVEAATGSLTLVLKKNTDYTFVFWADKGVAKTEGVVSSGYWNTDNLQEVVVSVGKESSAGEVAYCLVTSFNSEDFEANKVITLKNATAQLNFVEATGLLEANNTLMVKYPNSGKLNVATGAITEIAGEVSRTYSNIAQTAKDGILATDYILAPLSEKRLVDLNVVFNAEAEKTINSVPFQQSYKTNIKGEYSNLYSSVFTISNEVEEYINNEDVLFPEKAKVGDFYMKDGTWWPGAITLSSEQQANCIGIIYWIGDPTINDAALKAAHPNCTHGLVVALKEEEPTVWQTIVTDVNVWTTANTSYAPINSGDQLTDPINKIMGYNNTKAIEAFNVNIAPWYKVEWVDKLVAYRTAVPTPGSNSGWFLPSAKELALLSGLNNQDDNIFANSYGTDNRDAINLQLEKVSGSTQIDNNQTDNNRYWSSTEVSSDNNSSIFAWSIYFGSGITYSKNKEQDANIRFVSAF